MRFPLSRAIRCSAKESQRCSFIRSGARGLSASRLTEKFYRPTIILTESNGMATGSARSVKDFDIYNAIESCSDLLEQFGGHMYAAGLTLRLENIPKFIERFEEI